MGIDTTVADQDKALQSSPVLKCLVWSLVGKLNLQTGHGLRISKIHMFLRNMETGNPKRLAQAEQVKGLWALL